MLVLSLGSIVKTNDMKAILAFQALADELHLGIQVPSLMHELKPLFIGFNVGEISETDFKQSVMKIFFEQTNKNDKYSKETFLKKFPAAWNAMCEIDQQAIDVLQEIAKRNNIRIYSDTNPMHFVHLEPTIRTCGLDPEMIQTTFKNKCSKEALLKILVNALRASGFTKPITLLLGKNDKITDPVLLEMTEERDERVVGAASSVDVMIERLTEARVSVLYLKALEFIAGYTAKGATIRLLPPLTPRFDAARSSPQSSPENSPRSGAQSPVEEAVVEEQEAASSSSPRVAP